MTVAKKARVGTPTENRVAELRARLKAWGEHNIAEYPWRYEGDPYAVLVAEFMLHRTKASQVVPVYRQFMDRWPTLEAWSRTNQAEAEQILSSLGLRWRIDGMIRALDRLWAEYGAVPADISKLKAIHGIGPYIAGATVCFALNRPVALVDTNTVRVIGRVFGLNLRGEARRRSAMITAIEEACDPVNPRDFYYAIIDIAHGICRPANPSHLECPLLEVPCDLGMAEQQ